MLQLDLCDFTRISSKITPMQLAHTLHEMFSAFDTAVQRLNLFKVDTVGDAFIVAAWLPHRDHTLQDPRSRGNMTNKMTLVHVERLRKAKAFETQLCTKMFSATFRLRLVCWRQCTTPGAGASTSAPASVSALARWWWER